MLDDTNLLPYQVEGVNRILNQDRLYLGDDPGLGKTAQFIRACYHMHPSVISRGIVVVCPASLRENWKQEWKKWNGPIGMPLHILSYQQATADCYDKKPPKGKKPIGLLKQKWGVVGFDEAHALKNTKSQRLKSGLIYNIWREERETGDEEDPIEYIFHKAEGICAVKTVMMSGTPILNKPVDIFPVIRHLDPHEWPSKSKFEMRYCDGHVNKFGIWDTSGASNTAELKGRLTGSGILLRRLKKDVLQELPEKRRQILHLQGAVKSTNACESLLRAAMKATRLTDAVSDIAWESRALEEFELLKGSHVSQIRMELGKAKVKPCIDYIIEQHGLGILPDKLVVFAHHREVIEQIVDALNKKKIKAKKYYGGMNDKEKDAVVKSFQDGDTQVFVGSISSAGVGLTLTAASDAIILEPSYVPAENVQAEDRIHRIGAVNSVLIQYVALAGSMDSRILQLVVEKMEMIQEIMS